MTTQPSPSRDLSRSGVQLSELVFTLSWEDPELDRGAFAARPGARIATVASGGCNALTFLLDDPERVLAFDYNSSQIHLLALKVAAFRYLDHGALLELFGLRPSRRREQLFQTVAPALSADAREVFEREAWLFQYGLIGFGRYERFVGHFRRLLRVIHGRRRLEALFEARDTEQQRKFFEEEWNTLPWRLLFKAFFNKTVLARRGLSADYFSFDDGSRSFAESFAQRTARALCELSTRDNPFLAQYVLGRYVSEQGMPSYLRPESFDIVKGRLDRLEARVADVRDVFSGAAAGEFDGICLSNVFELMPPEDTDNSLAEVARVLDTDGTLTLRNLMVPRSVPASLSAALVLDVEASRRLHATDRSFVYASFQVYRRSARRPP